MLLECALPRCKMEMEVQHLGGFFPNAALY